MSRFYLIAALSFATASLGPLPCRAQTSLPVNSAATSSTTRPYIVPVRMRPQQMAILKTVMNSKYNYCFLQDLQPKDDSSMVLICSAAPPTVDSISP